MRIFFVFLLMILTWQPLTAFATTTEADSTAAVILAYLRIGEDSFPDTNLRTEQFAEHVNELTDGSYNIISLPELISAYKTSTALPQNTIVLTFEGGYKSALKNAIPLLLEKDIPFTVFFAADQAGSKSPHYMSWKDLKALQGNELVSFGLLPAAYTRLSGQGRNEILHEINRAKTQYRQNLKGRPIFFSYPFGEYDDVYVDIVQSQGFDAGLGLQSGVSHAGMNLLKLPRFSITESYGDIDRLRMVANALPLPITDLTPDYSTQNDGQPKIGFTLHNDLALNADRMTCFVSGDVNLSQEIIGERRIELRLDGQLHEQRTRINCTMPGPKDSDTDAIQWRWLGMLLVYEVQQNSAQTTPPAPVLP